MVKVQKVTVEEDAWLQSLQVRSSNTDAGRQLTVSVFDDLGWRINNQLFYKSHFIWTGDDKSFATENKIAWMKSQSRVNKTGSEPNMTVIYNEHLISFIVCHAHKVADSHEVYKTLKVQLQHRRQTFNFFTELLVILQLGLDKQNLVYFPEAQLKSVFIIIQPKRNTNWGLVSQPADVGQYQHAVRSPFGQLMLENQYIRGLVWSPPIFKWLV